MCFCPEIKTEKKRHSVRRLGERRADLTQKDHRRRSVVRAHLQQINVDFKVVDLTVLTYKFLWCGSLALGDAVCETIDICHLV